MNIFNADCLEKMKDIEDKSINLIFVDLPYTDSNFGKYTNCKWDEAIDLNKMWTEFKRIRLDTTPIIFTCSTKFGYTLIESNKKEFRYDMVWIKGDTGYCCEKCNYKKEPKISKTGFLNSKRLPLKSHEMVYIFYKKCPSETYGNNIKKYHKHKFLDKEDNKRPTDTYKNNSDLYGNIDRPDFKRKNGESMYKPPLPNSILEIKSQKGKHSTQKPTKLSDFFIKYYSNEGDIVLDCCMGSGSTGVSCKNLNRRFIGIEKDEEIFKVAKERLNI